MFCYNDRRTSRNVDCLIRTSSFQDKKKEDPYWLVHGKYRDLSDYGHAVQLVEEECNSTFSSIFLMSDSQAVIETALKNPNFISFNPRATILYDKSVNRSSLAQGHVHVPVEIKKEVQDHFVAAVYALMRSADHVVCTLSSNVARLFFQYVTAKGRAAQVSAAGAFVTSLDYPEWATKEQAWFP